MPRGNEVRPAKDNDEAEATAPVEAKDDDEAEATAPASQRRSLKRPRLLDIAGAASIAAFYGPRSSISKAAMHDTQAVPVAQVTGVTRGPRRKRSLQHWLSKAHDLHHEGAMSAFFAERSSRTSYSRTHHTWRGQRKEAISETEMRWGQVWVIIPPTKLTPDTKHTTPSFCAWMTDALELATRGPAPAAAGSGLRLGRG